MACWAMKQPCLYLGSPISTFAKSIVTLATSTHLMHPIAPQEELQVLHLLQRCCIAITPRRRPEGLPNVGDDGL